MDDRKGCQVVIGYDKTELSPEALDLISRGVGAGEVCHPDEHDSGTDSKQRHAVPDMPFPEHPWDA
jgi:hypothetical protein